MIIEITLITASAIGYIGKKYKYISSKKNENRICLKKSNLPQKFSQWDEDKKEKQRAKRNLMLASLSVGSAMLGTLYASFNIIATFGVLFLAGSTIKHMLKTLRKERKIGFDFLLTITMVIMIYSGHYLVMAGGAWIYYLGTLIQLKAKGESKKALFDLFQEQSGFVWIVHEDTEIEIPLEQLKKGDTFVVNTGEKILADGTIIQGQALVDQQLLTGEFQPAEKLSGDKVFASTIVLSGKIYVQAEKMGYQTLHTEIRHMLLKAADTKSFQELKGEEWANKSALPVLGASILSVFAFNPVMGLCILNSAPGSTIRFIGPIVTINHLKIAAQSGILIKDGRALEKLNSIDTILFDKTGTLTTTEPFLNSITSYAGKEENEILIYAASAESKLDHPIANAIKNEAQRRNLELIPITDSEYKVGLGITVFIDDLIIRVGSPKFMEQEGISLEDAQQNLTVLQEKGHTCVLVALNERLIGALELQAEIRPEAQHLVNLFHSKNIKMYLVSGDQQFSVQSLSDKLGLNGCFYEVLPNQKKDIVKQFKEEGKTVCFVGDGINDTIAMQTADISISFRGASSIATDVAQIILTDGNLVKLEKLFEIAKSTDRHLENSFKVSILLSPLLSLGGIVFIPGFGLASILTIKTACKFFGLGHAMLCTKHDFKSKQIQNNVGGQ